MLTTKLHFTPAGFDVLKSRTPERSVTRRFYTDSLCDRFGEASISGSFAVEYDIPVPDAPNDHI